MASTSPYRALFDANPLPMWVYDVETLRFLDVNQAALLKYGYSRDEFLARRLTDIRPPADNPPLKRFVRSRHGRNLMSTGPRRHRLRDGRIIAVEITSHTMTFAGRPAVMVCARDISVEQALEERLQHHALHDALTGVATRHHLVSQLDEAASKSKGGGDGRHALLAVDIEDMKTLNAEYGREAGDQVLVAVVERLAATLKGRGRLARLGGGTFGVALPDVVDAERARGYASELLAALDEPFWVEGREAQVLAYVGIAIQEAGWTADDLIRAADAALQSASEGRDGRVAIFNADQNSLLDVFRRERQALEVDLRRALSAGQLHLVYQPLLDLRSNTISGVEALVRWEHPQLGLIMPNYFIPIAEHSGLIRHIDAWVIASACRQARAWRDSGLPPLIVSTNVSGRDLDTRGDLVAVIRGELKRNHLEPPTLEIELTESAAIRSHEEVDNLLDELRTLGVRVALDDFGTGYSMLERIRDLHVDRIKIDRTFVRRLASEGGALVAAIINMAQSLHLEVVAEGVENEHELEFLRDHGCDFAQGYLISRPVPAAAIDALLHKPLTLSLISAAQRRSA